MAKVALIQNMAYEYLGFMYLSSVLKREGHDAEVFITAAYGCDRLIEDLKKYNPRIMGFSCTTGVHNWALRLAGCLKNNFPGITIIFGGAHPTFCPDIIADPSVDVICRGEGEYGLLDLADSIDQGRDYSGVPNLWVKDKKGNIFKNKARRLVTRLDTIPFPDRNLYIKKYPFLNKSQKAFITSRGCPYSCAYCSNDALRDLYAGEGQFVRRRSVTNVLEEIKHAAVNFEFKTVYFQDDTFILDKEWTSEFVERYKKEIGKPFVCCVTADSINGDIARQLKESGCKTVFFGIETGEEYLRQKILKKQITDAHICNAAFLFKKNRIKLRSYNILSLPGETIQQALKTVEINVKIGTDYPWCSLYSPLPATALAEYAKENHFLGKDYLSHIGETFFENSPIRAAHKNELVNLQRLFIYAVKFPFLLPLIKRIIRFKTNFIFDIAFLCSYSYCYMRSENMSFWEFSNIGIRNLKSFLVNKTASKNNRTPRQMPTQ